MHSVYRQPTRKMQPSRYLILPLAFNLIASSILNHSTPKPTNLGRIALLSGRPLASALTTDLPAPLSTLEYRTQPIASAYTPGNFRDYFDAEYQRRRDRIRNAILDFSQPELRIRKRTRKDFESYYMRSGCTTRDIQRTRHTDGIANVEQYTIGGGGCG